MHSKLFRKIKHDNFNIKELQLAARKWRTPQLLSLVPRFSEGFLTRIYGFFIAGFEIIRHISQKGTKLCVVWFNMKARRLYFAKTKLKKARTSSSRNMKATDAFHILKKDVKGIFWKDIAEIRKGINSFAFYRKHIQPAIVSNVRAFSVKI